MRLANLLTIMVFLSLPGELLSADDDAAAATLLGHLSPEHLKSLGQMLDEDWQDRPEWGEMAIAILKGDFMRPNVGWWTPSVKRYDWTWLRDRYDANQDGKVERDELAVESPDGETFFSRLDRDRSGELTESDFDHSDSAGRNRGGMSMAAMKDAVSGQLFRRLDGDSNGQVTLEEVAGFFLEADQEALGFMTPEDLRTALDEPPKPASGEGEGDAKGRASEPATPAVALRMFLASEFGWLGAGPGLNEPAPDFNLPKQDRSSLVKLSDSFDKRPVVLIFGSFT